MFTLALCLSFLSIYGLYALSNKVEVEKKGIMLFLQKRKTLTWLLAGSTFIVSTLIFSGQLGPAVGMLTSFMLWTVLAGFIILFMPFEQVKWGYWVGMVVLIMLIEVGVPMM